MTLFHDYKNSSRRNIFRLRNPELNIQSDFDSTLTIPSRYAELNEDEKKSMDEFINFIFAHREEIKNNENLHFRIRDHENRPVDIKNETSKEKPHDYDELENNERFHVYEFISFLIKRR